MKREIVSNALKHKSQRALPYNIELTKQESKLVCDHLGISENAYFDWSGNHIEKLGYNFITKEIRPGYFADEFGVVWNRRGLDKDIGVIEEITFKVPDINGYVFPEPDIDDIKNKTDVFVNNKKDTYKFGKLGLSLFERAWSLRGMENLLMDLILEPAFVSELFDNILEYNLKILDAVLDHGLDGIYFGDDYGQQLGLIMSPDLWREHIKPVLAKMFDRVKSTGKTTALHSCGNIIEILPDLIDSGLDIYQTVQPEIYDLTYLKKEFGNDLCFWGGISTQSLLPYADEKKLREIVVDTIEIMSKNGGYIASPTHQVPNDVPVQNIVLLWEIFKSY